MGIETFMFQKTLKFEIERRQRETQTYFSIDELGRRNTGRGEPLLSKEARIRLMQPLFEQGLIEIRKDMSDYVDEILSFPRGKNDDLIDASAWLIEKLIPSAGVYQAEQEKEGTMDWWTKKMPKAKSTIYERFMADLK